MSPKPMTLTTLTEAVLELRALLRSIEIENKSMRSKVSSMDSVLGDIGAYAAVVEGEGRLSLTDLSGPQDEVCLCPETPFTGRGSNPGCPIHGAGAA